MGLMLAGNAGLVTPVASVVFTVVRTGNTTSAALRGGVLIVYPHQLVSS